MNNQDLENKAIPSRLLISLGLKCVRCGSLRKTYQFNLCKGCLVRDFGTFRKGGFLN